MYVHESWANSPILASRPKGAGRSPPCCFLDFFFLACIASFLHRGPLAHPSPIFLRWYPIVSDNTLRLWCFFCTTRLGLGEMIRAQWRSPLFRIGIAVSCAMHYLPFPFVHQAHACAAFLWVLAPSYARRHVGSGHICRGTRYRSRWPGIACRLHLFPCLSLRNKFKKEKKNRGKNKAKKEKGTKEQHN